jgi:hypothetical protein
MAQIRIEEKKSGGGSIWPWILGLLLLGLIIWGVAEAFEESDETYTEEILEDDAEVAPVAAAAAVDYDDSYYQEPRDEYMAFTEDIDGEMGLDHEYSHQALTRLANATSAIAVAKGVESETDANSKANRVKQLADEIMKDPMAGDHGDKIKMAAMLITEILEDVDQNAYNNVSSNELQTLREEAQAIKPETLALDQKGDIKSFFKQARMVLEKMS